MAATTVIDLNIQSTWPIKLGASITAPKAPSRFSNVRFNYQPRLKNKYAVKRKLTAGDSSTKCEALIKNGQHEWRYEGEQDSRSDNYILIITENHGKKTARLEKVNNSIALNVVQTPSSTDTEDLRRRYAQISVHEEDGNDVSTATKSGEADPKNPYDFRHYLGEASVKEDISKSTTSTPLTHPTKPSTASSTSHPSKSLPKDTLPKKRKPAVENTQQKSKRVKKEPQKAAAKAKPLTSAPSENVPEVRISRRATEPNEATHSDADSGELILENDDDEQPSRRDAGSSSTMAKSNQKRPTSMAMALSGQLGPGPISLHSAASSPASHIHTPGPETSPPIPGETTYEFDFGGDDDSDEPHQADEEDADVEDLELPSPVQDRARNAQVNEASTAAAAHDDEDDDDDLEEQLARAMAEQDDPAPSRIDVEEESEEE